VPGTSPWRGVWRRPGVRSADLIVFAALLCGLPPLAPALNAPLLPRSAPVTMPADPASLPYRVVRSLPRMFVGLRGKYEHASEG
jgi:NitT/TauT family transport system permease protein